MKRSSGRIKVGLFLPTFVFVIFVAVVLSVAVSQSKENPRHPQPLTTAPTAASASSAASEGTTDAAEPAVSNGGIALPKFTFSVTTTTTSNPYNTLDEFITAFGLSRDDYPTKLLELLDRNPDAAEYVMNYPLKKDEKPEYSMSAYKHCDEVPLLLQWDERWGYLDYGGELMGLSGCGPTALSMVCIYLLQDTSLDPAFIARYSVENGYRVQGNGTSWSLMSKGARDLGLKSEELTLSENQVVEHLKKGDPVICVVGPGDFTETGHFLVMTDYEDGKIRLNDPNSPTRSQMLWTWDRLSRQIKNLWALSK